MFPRKYRSIAEHLGKYTSHRPHVNCRYEEKQQDTRFKQTNTP